MKVKILLNRKFHDSFVLPAKMWMNCSNTFIIISYSFNKKCFCQTIDQKSIFLKDSRILTCFIFVFVSDEKVEFFSVFACRLFLSSSENNVVKRCLIENIVKIPLFAAGNTLQYLCLLHLGLVWISCPDVHFWQSTWLFFSNYMHWDCFLCKLCRELDPFSCVLVL